MSLRDLLHVAVHGSGDARVVWLCWRSTYTGGFHDSTQFEFLGVRATPRGLRTTREAVERARASCEFCEPVEVLP